MRQPTAITLPNRRSPMWHLTAATVLVALAGVASSLAQAQPAMKPGEPALRGGMHQAMHRPNMGHGGAEGHHRAGGMMLPERALDAVGATAEQKTRVRDIFKAAHSDMQQQREAGRTQRQQMMALMAAPQIDTAAAEGLRQQQQARHDAASKRSLQAMLDAQAVLTPEQRAKLAEHLKSRTDMMERHRHERRGMNAPRS